MISITSHLEEKLVLVFSFKASEIQVVFTLILFAGELQAHYYYKDCFTNYYVNETSKFHVSYKKVFMWLAETNYLQTIITNYSKPNYLCKLSIVEHPKIVIAGQIWRDIFSAKDQLIRC